MTEARDTADKELRLITSIERRKLVELLDAFDAWKDLVTVIPHPRKDGQFLFNSNNIRILENVLKSHNQSPSSVLIEYWSTTGKKHERPKLSTLVACLNQAGHKRIADFVTTEILGQATLICEDDKEVNLEASAPEEDVSSQINGIDNWSYSFLSQLTDNFKDDTSGCKVGEGAFGSVYRAVLPDSSSDLEVAIKVLKGELTSRQFINEIQIMKDFHHENLLPLVAVSVDGPFLCLVSKFMPLGSLNKYLMSSGHELDTDKRMSVAIGTARGLNHLHTFLPQPFVHRDVKSDNILLDNDLTAKVGDFGLTRVGSQGSGLTKSKYFTQNVIGTSVYMAPEAFRGDVSVKLDVFAFGVVLLELLTGLKPYDEDRDEPDLLTHVEEVLEGHHQVSLTDARIDGWTQPFVTRLLDLSKSCTKQRKKDRPNMTQILDRLLSAVKSDP